MTYNDRRREKLNLQAEWKMPGFPGVNQQNYNQFLSAAEPP